MIKHYRKQGVGGLQQSLALIVATVTKTFLYLIGSGDAPTVVHTMTETSTLLKTFCGLGHPRPKPDKPI